jgi:hypothetical protein
LRPGAVFSAVIVNPPPLEVGNDPFRSGRNFAVTIYVDPNEPEKRILIAATSLAPFPAEFNISKILVRWTGVSK